MATNYDKPILQGFEITNTLEIISDALIGGDNWESFEKRKTASKWLIETRCSIEYHVEIDPKEASIIQFEEKK